MKIKFVIFSLLAIVFFSGTTFADYDDPCDPALENTEILQMGIVINGCIYVFDYRIGYDANGKPYTQIIEISPLSKNCDPGVTWKEIKARCYKKLWETELDFNTNVVVASEKSCARWESMVQEDHTDEKYISTDIIAEFGLEIVPDGGIINNINGKDKKVSTQDIGPKKKVKRYGFWIACNTSVCCKVQYKIDWWIRSGQEEIKSVYHPTSLTDFPTYCEGSFPFFGCEPRCEDLIWTYWIDTLGNEHWYASKQAIQITSNEGNVILAPNPNSGIFSLSVRNELKGNISISILTLDGKEVYNNIDTKDSEEYYRDYDFSHLSSGTYYISISINNEKLTSTKFVIAN